MQIPLFARQLLLGAAVGAMTAVIALNLAIPGSLSEARAEALTVGLAVIGAVARAATAAVPSFIAFLAEKLGVPQDPTSAN